MLDYLRGFAILVGVYLLGTFLNRLGLPIPGGVLGLLLFFVALTSGVIKMHWVERASVLLLRHMVLLFLPLTVGLMEMGSVLSRNAAAIIASLLVSWIAVLLTTGLLGRWLLKDDSEPASGLRDNGVESTGRPDLELKR